MYMCISVLEIDTKHGDIDENMGLSATSNRWLLQNATKYQKDAEKLIVIASHASICSCIIGIQMCSNYSSSVGSGKKKSIFLPILLKFKPNKSLFSTLDPNPDT